MRSRLASVLLAAVLPTASSWSIFAGGSTAPFPDYRNVSNAMASSIRWTYRRPLIRWALAPDFCATMQPLISENSAVSFFISQKWQNFSTCARIHSIIRESFDVWAAANPAITFVDVTSRCEAERMWVPIADDRCAESTWCLERENATLAEAISGERGRYGCVYENSCTLPFTHSRAPSQSRLLEHG